MSSDSAGLNLRFAIRATRRRLPILVACLVIVPAVAVAYALLQKKEYTATASLLFRDPQFDQKLFGTSYVQNQIDPARVAATNIELVSLPRVAAQTASRLRNLTESQVESDVSVSSNSQSDLITIQAVARDPRFAAELANTYGEVYIGFRQGADRATIDSARAPLRSQIAALPRRQRFGSLGQSLQQRLSQLNVLARLQTGGAELVQRAEVPKSPSSPQPKFDAILGLFFGLLLGVGLVVVAEALDRRLRDPTEVEELYERPLLTALPQSSSLPTADPTLAGAAPAEREAFRMLWVNLRYFSVSRDIRSVLITSADRDDGKSTVAWGLAVAAASAGQRTLLIEADLRNPTFAKRFKVAARHGLTSVLAGDISREDAVSHIDLFAADRGNSESRRMDVLFAGPRPPDPTDLLQSRPMADFVANAENDYDLVVIDTPPAVLVSDAVPLIALVRGVIVVSRLGNTLREHSRRLRQQLDQLDTPLIGVVVNSIGPDNAYGYAYSYGYSSEEFAGPPGSGRPDGSGVATQAEAANGSGSASSRTHDEAAIEPVAVQPNGGQTEDGVDA